LSHCHSPTSPSSKTKRNKVQKDGPFGQKKENLQVLLIRTVRIFGVTIIEMFTYCGYLNHAQNFDEVTVFTLRQTLFLVSKSC